MGKNNLNLLLLLLAIVTTSGAIMWSFLSGFTITLSLVLIAVDGAFIASVFSLSQKAQRKITYFFDAVENNDSTIFFNEKIKGNTEKGLNQSLNRVNGLIKEIKQRLIEQENYYQTILEQASSGILCIDDKKNVLLANKSAIAFFDVIVLTHLTQLKRVDEHLYKRLATIEGNDNFSISFTTSKGRVQLSASVSVFKIDQENIHLISLQDISTPLSDKEMESWTKLTQVLTHEIMNNLAPVISLSQDIQKRLDNSTLEPEKAKKAFEIIQNQSQSLLTFVETYRKFTKLPLPNKQDIKVSDLFDRLRILYGSFPESEHITFKVSNPKQDYNLFVDEGQMVQVLINLVKNAIEAFNHKSNGTIHLWAAEKGSQRQSQIYIEDNGSGISEDIKESIFVPFFTTKNNGSGIGLSLVSQIIRLHNGSIELMESDDKTIFKIVI